MGTIVCTYLHLFKIIQLTNPAIKILELDDVVKINVVDSNSQFLLNKTLDIINNEKLMSTSTVKPVADLGSNSTNTTNAEPEAPTENSESSAEMESISNLLSNVSSLKEASKFQFFSDVLPPQKSGLWVFDLGLDPDPNRTRHRFRI